MPDNGQQKHEGLDAMKAANVSAIVSGVAEGREGDHGNELKESCEKRQSQATAATTSSVETIFALRSEWSDAKPAGKVSKKFKTCDDDALAEAEPTQKKAFYSRTIAKTRLTFTGKMRDFSYVINPQSKRRLAWDTWSLLMISYDVIFLPIQMFEVEQTDIMMWLTALTWTGDVFLSFMTGIFIKGKLCMNPRTIARRYAMTWLPLDVSLCTLDWVSLWMKGENVSGSSLLRILRLVRFLRLLRVAKAAALFQLMLLRINSSIMVLTFTLFRLILSMIMANHFIACMWYGIGIAYDDGWAYTTGIAYAEFAYKYTSSTVLLTE
eukprot:gnl/TRDRNA2_/TRDRNA2_147117_c0_seq3.p1 gnl/TRDRNA2_/TRDRNA2_147117_c0~~gnl/TRDRNA2_/TRDRNA2_147117_c0_seq3.p1  ORF type:complete len:351 (+),score=37.72 gnl/TRDRNA2_/TRDRNA2_147117_c0_seq3:85-1053(+)